MVELNKEINLIRLDGPSNRDDTLADIPKKTGIYIFRDKNNEIIYIGKAKSLRDRVKSYFTPSNTNNFNYHAMSNFPEKIRSIDYVVTDSEYEALVMESNFIKKNRPRYNVSLRDDKSYPFIVITEGEDYPRIFISRNRNLKKAKYFGPYTNVQAARETLEMLRRIFKIRDCKKEKPGKYRDKVCLNYHLSLCSGPCMGHIDKEKYQDNIDYIKMFLKGRDKTLKRELKEKMKVLSKAQKYEQAAEIKEKIDFIEELNEKQKIFINTEDTWDVLACVYERKRDIAVISVYTYKKGELAIINNFILNEIRFLGSQEMLEGFIKKYYLDMDNLPNDIYISEEIGDACLLSKWLSDLKGKSIKIHRPKKGDKKKILDMVKRNAGLYLEKKKFEKDMGFNKAYKELVSIKDVLGLTNTPRRVECYDISNLKDTHPVGSMVVFSDGAALKSDYRHFRIKRTTGQNDYAMISEVIERRLSFLDKRSDGQKDKDESFCKVPDLMVIDGGKGQLSAALDTLRQKNIQGIDVISIAKKEEKVYCLNYINGIKFDKGSNITRLLTKIRDEAHRFAVNYHRHIRSKAMTHTILDDIKGIGDKKKKYIFDKVGSISELKNSSLQELMDIKGITYKDALNIFKNLNR